MDQPDATTTPVTCPDCHALVSDLDAHAHWHARLVADLARAVSHEISRTASGR